MRMLLLLNISSLWYSLVIATILLRVEPVSCLKCISCRCGSSFKNYTQCIEKETKEEFTCNMWAHCQTCKANTTHCNTCPPKRFGPLCSEGIAGHIRRKRQNLRSTHCENQGSIANGRMTVVRASTQPLLFEEEEFELPVGTRLHYSCYTGYVLQGPTVLVCEDTGYWSEEKPPICIEDSSIRCPDPGQIEYGSYRNSDGNSETSQQYAVGQLVIYSCQNGYVIVGSKEVTCMPSGSWSTKPSCRRTTDAPVPIDTSGRSGSCPNPGSIANGYRRLTQGVASRSRTFSPGQSLRYFCNDGFELEGSNVITCLTSGRWSSSTPRCSEKTPSVNCPEPGSIQNGFRQLTIDSPSTDTGTYSDGQSFRYFCNYGYELRGNSRLTCLPSGAWSSNAPTCQEVAVSKRKKRKIRSFGATHCENEGPIPNGRVHVRRVLTMPLQYVDDFEFPVGTRLHYSCDQGYVLKGAADQICEDSGFWSEVKPYCIEIKCKKFGPFLNGRVVVYFTSRFKRRKTIDEENGLNYPVGTWLSYACNNGYVLRGNEMLNCESTGKWSADEPICIRESVQRTRRKRQKSVQRIRRKRQTISSELTNCENEDPLLNGRVKVIWPGPRRSVEGDYEFPVGTRLLYFCDEGYILQGVAELICENTAFWSAKKPICIEVKCMHHGHVLNGRVVVFFNSVINRRKTIHEENGPNYPVGTSLHYECDYGYMLRGNKTLFCESTGKWSSDEPTCVEECGVNSIDPSLPVISGRSMTTSEWPWTVAITVNENNTTRFLCSGVLLDKMTVLTVAHCVYEARNYILYFGKFELNFESQARLTANRTSSRIILHRNFNIKTFDNDIAIIFFKPPVDYSETIQPICLPTQDSSKRNLAAGENGFVSGWETVSISSPLQALSMIQLPVLSEQTCKGHYRKKSLTLAVTPGMFCAGLKEHIDGFCFMATGSPMAFYNAETDSYTLEGLVSWGANPNCPKGENYYVFTRVSTFLPWILENWQPLKII